MGWSLTDYSLGIVDNVLDADPRAAAKMDNLLLTLDRKPYQRPAIVPAFAAATQLPPGNQRIDSIFRYDSTTFAKSGTNLYYRADADSAWTTLQTLSSKAAFGDSVLGASVSWSIWNGHVFATPMPYSGAISGCRTIMIYKRSSDSAWVCEQAGVPSMKDISGFDPPAGLGSGSGGQEHSFVFAIAFRRTREVMVDGVATRILNYGYPSVWQIRMEMPDSGTADYSFTAPNFTNGSLDNYTDSAFGESSLRVSSFRTKANDTPLYFDDTTSQSSAIVYERTDDEIGTKADNKSSYEPPEFYMNGGRKPNNKVPHCYYSMVLDGYGFYLGYVDADDGILYQNRLVQSHPGNPEGVWFGNYCEFNGPARGLSHIGSYPIVLTSVGAYRIEGRFDVFGGGSMRAQLIPGSEPCVHGKAVVKLDEGLIYASYEGWVWTDGYQAANIASHLTDTYGNLLNLDRMSMCYDSARKHVYIGVEDPQNTAVSSVNNRYYIIDMNFSSPRYGCFMTATSGARSQPHSLFYDRKLQKVFIGDQRGYVMTFDEASYGDSRVDTGVTFTSWAKLGVVWDYLSVAYSHRDPENDKYFPKVSARFRKVTGDLSAEFYARKNMEATDYESRVVRDRGVTRGLHKVERWVGSGARWATYFQIGVRKASLVVFNSDTYGTATTSGVANTVQRIAGNWPTNADGTNLVGYFISFESDDYTASWEISAQSTDTLTVLDAGNTLPSVIGTKWQIIGEPKAEGAKLDSITVEIGDMGDATDGYQEGDDGANA